MKYSREIEDILSNYEFDEKAHSKGRCSYSLLAICSGEEQRIKMWMRKALQEYGDKIKKQERDRWLTGGVCRSCGEDIFNSKGLSDTCGKCLQEM